MTSGLRMIYNATVRGFTRASVVLPGVLCCGWNVIFSWLSWGARLITIRQNSWSSRRNRTTMKLLPRSRPYVRAGATDHRRRIRRQPVSRGGFQSDSAYCTPIRVSGGIARTAALAQQLEDRARRLARLDDHQRPACCAYRVSRCLIGQSASACLNRLKSRQCDHQPAFRPYCRPCMEVPFGIRFRVPSDAHMAASIEWQKDLKLPSIDSLLEGIFVEYCDSIRAVFVHIISRYAVSR